ncbi:hypothetical protein SAMN05892883_3563 [Jatrophihabitans sp. GAS493]|uniref:polyketide cyclase / dehydrase and lipid transport n=1 Tax=Jatrophihabitans sp. GAS493 TaxID=1907575 RepID=UPI000BB8F21A|nr:polyketide cyclase / dehydrase and lipid transport [Jatrophihabitans sp. GAS493]SOD74379.1 hypothetical protein SAMN05892883_3563 [Jatrophihabitans sp. GAS493]
MPEVDLVDATWIAAAPVAVAPVIADQTNWSRWWPGMTLRIDRDRGPLGIQWFVTSCTDFSRQGMSGSMEIWLEPAYEGVVLHYFLRLDSTSGRLGRRAVRRAQRSHALRAKRNFWAVKDQLEAAGR